jgi:CDP-diacylglycerol--serine O-phosphatidyltransferase
MAFLILKMLRESSKQKLCIPFIFTFLNAFFGLVSVIKVLDGQFFLAAYFIILAACMDFCDGRLARAFGSSTCIGMELDSLCDAISFCFAPAILLYSWCLYESGIFGLCAVGLYLCSGLFRLAKFNVTSSSKTDFIGLPTTIAAFLIANMVLASDWISLTTFYYLVYPQSIIIMLILLSLLELSCVTFLSFKQIRSKSCIFYLMLLTCMSFGLFLCIKKIPVFFIGTIIYILINLAHSFYLYFINSIKMQ